MSKFPLSVLNDRVFKHLPDNDPDVILGATFGEDVALTSINEHILVSHLDPIVGAVKNIGWLAVHVACNDIATSGALPRWILLLILVPRKSDLLLLEEIMCDCSRAASEAGAVIIGGHTGYSTSLSRPMVAATALGTLSGQKPICTKGAQIGDHIFVTKGIGMEGTAILASDFSSAARQLGLREDDLIEARKLITDVSIISEAMIFAKHGATSMHDVTRGGLLETLLEMAELSEVMMQVDGQRIPNLTIVSQFAEAFQFDPMKMISSGTLVATVPPACVDSISQSLREIGLLFADVGQVTKGKGVWVSWEGRDEHFQEIQCEADELARMWEIYSRGEG